ncbi:glycosyltransferase family 2 protein [Methylobacterium komagatae]
MPKSGPSLVDVIMPAHNAAITIEASIRSALAYPRCRRVLVVDDASSDQTAALVESLAARADGRIELIRLSANSGPARARNIGLSYVEADLVAFLDADDLYEHEALTATVGALDGMPDLAVVRMALKPIGLDRAYLARPDFEAGVDAGDLHGAEQCRHAPSGADRCGRASRRTSFSGGVAGRTSR